MEALKTFDVKELLKRQAELDRKFDDKETIRKRTEGRVLIAYFTELGELSQELKGEWNYWKNTAKRYDKNRVLEELSDVLHFFLSYLNLKKCMRTANFERLELDILQYHYNESIEVSLECLFDLDTILIGVEAYHYFRQMLNIVLKIGASKQEFLKVHHEKWLKNINERTKEEY